MKTAAKGAVRGAPVGEIQRPVGEAAEAQRCPKVEARLSGVTGVEECVVLRRPTAETGKDCGETIVAYIRPSAAYELGKLRRQVSAAALGPVPLVPVMVRRIPRLDDGAVDVAALLTVPVITAAAVRQQLSQH